MIYQTVHSLSARTRNKKQAREAGAEYEWIGGGVCVRSEQEAPTQSSLAFFARVQFEFSGDSIRSNTPTKIWRAVNVLVNYTKGQPKQVSSVDIRESQMGVWGVGAIIFFLL